MRAFVLCVIAAAIGMAADKKPAGPVQSGNDVVEVIGSAHVGRQAATQLLGHDPGFDLIVIDVKVVPKLDNKVNLYLDDFTLLSNKDGQRSQPLAPGQIAGRGGMVISSGGGGGRGIGIGSGPAMGGGGPIYGGIGDRPRRIGGDGDIIGGGGSTNSQASSIQTGAGEKESPLLKTLKERQLKEGETGEEVTGLMYFLFEGKHKLKDLDLIYKSKSGRVILDFER